MASNLPSYDNNIYQNKYMHKVSYEQDIVLYSPFCQISSEQHSGQK